MRRLFDLTRPLGPHTPALPGDPPVTATSRSTHADDGYAVLSLCLGTHAGTHVDAPFHMLPDGATLDAVPLSRFVGQAALLDVRRPAETAIVREDLALAAEAWRRRAGDRSPAGVRSGSSALGGATIALVWTGWDRHFGTSLAVRHPFLIPDAAAWLVETGVGLVGTDAFSLDPVLGETFPVHRLLLGAGVPLVENLANLEELATQTGDVTCAMLPLSLEGADGSPVRAVAWVEEDAGGESS